MVGEKSVASVRGKIGIECTFKLDTFTTSKEIRRNRKGGDAIRVLNARKEQTPSTVLFIAL